MIEKFLLLVVATFTLLANTLIAKENINRDFALDKSFTYSYAFDNAKLSLIDSVQGFKSIVDKEKSTVRPSIIVELFSSINKKSIKGENKRLTIYNTLRNYASLKGITYFSESGQRSKTLFKESYLADKSFNEIPQNILSNIPKNEKLYFQQKDLTLGVSQNIAELSSNDSSMSCHFYNTNELDYLFVTVVDKADLHTFFTVEEDSSRFKVYVVSFVTPSSLPLIKERISKSFGNRLVAMYNWFYKSIVK